MLLYCFAAFKLTVSCLSLIIKSPASSPLSISRSPTTTSLDFNIFCFSPKILSNSSLRFFLVISIDSSVISLAEAIFLYLLFISISCLFFSKTCNFSSLPNFKKLLAIKSPSRPASLAFVLIDFNISILELGSVTVSRLSPSKVISLTIFLTLFFSYFVDIPSIKAADAIILFWEVANPLPINAPFATVFQSSSFNLLATSLVLKPSR